MKKLINKFLMDPNVQMAMDWGKNRNVFEIMGITETSHSKMLAWLLNPREGHMQGDYFVKGLLREYFRGSEATCFDKLNDWPLDIYSFNNAIVYTELVVDDQTRIDIAIIDPESKIAIFIENKFGVSEGTINGKSQTKFYREKLGSDYKDYKVFFVFMDINGSVAKDKDNWISVDYSWLINSIDSLLGRDILPMPIEHLFLEYRNCIDNNEGKTPYFEKPYKLMSKVANEHKELIGKIKEIRAEVEPKEIMENYSSNTSTESNTSTDKVIKYFYLKDRTFFNSLFDYNQWGIFSEEIQKEIKSKVELDFDFYEKGFDFANESWYDLDNKEAEYCFMYVNIKQQKQESSSVDEYFVVEVITRQKYLKKDYQEAFKKLLDESSYDKRRHYRPFEKTVLKKKIVKTSIEAYKEAKKLYKKLTKKR